MPYRVICDTCGEEANGVAGELCMRDLTGELEASKPILCPGHYRRGRLGPAPTQKDA